MYPAYTPPPMNYPLLIVGLLGALGLCTLLVWAHHRWGLEKGEPLPKVKRELTAPLLCLPVVAVGAGVVLFTVPGVQGPAFWVCGFSAGMWIKLMFWPAVHKKAPEPEPEPEPEWVPAPVRRERIPPAVKSAVWRRDGGRCVRCGSGDRLEFGHIIPWSLGGSDSAENLQILCLPCNRREGNRI